MIASSVPSNQIKPVRQILFHANIRLSSTQSLIFEIKREGNESVKKKRREDLRQLMDYAGTG